ncbi:MAG: hypothetical protein GY925_01275 [Actinomycetia bacterium]|nr:hypothetical protein [Actinomycetes bacterium]
MTDGSNLQDVINNDWCIGCGVCSHADASIEVELDPRTLMYRPSSPGDERAASVCPAVAVDFAGLHEWLFPGAPVSEFGVVDTVLLAQSTDEQRNLAASSGGLIKELLRHYLASEDVDGVIALSHVEGLDFRQTVLTKPDEVDTLPGSIYHNLAQPESLTLLRENPGRYVLVGIPCQLEGIYQYIREFEPELKQKIHSTVGLLCGWQYNHHALRALGSYKKFDAEEITNVQYRGGGPIGKLRITTPEKEHVIGRRVDFGYQVAFDRSFNLARCHVCVDHSNFLADLVVGDAWLPSTVTTRTGVSMVVCRTAEASAAMAALETAGSIVTALASTSEVLESQKRRVVYGDFAYAYSEYLAEIGVPVPVMIGPNRSGAKLSPRKEVERFHDEFTRKVALQREGRYRFLFWRKATVELRRHLSRYVNWFFVRVLKVKSIFGKRDEVNRELLKGFR